jgi:DNA polymerase-3 subunit delta
MIAIKAHQAAAFMKAPPPQLSAALFFGSDVGLVSERSAALAAALADRETPRGEIMRLDDTELEADPARLEVELQMRPMFSSRRIVRAIAGRRITAQRIEPLLTSGPLEGLLIVEAGNLKTDDRLRRLFETSSGCYAVACYPDSAEDLDDLIDEVLAPYRIAIEADARGLLQSRLGADRALSRAEVEKLALFCLGRPAITLEDVENIVGDASDLVLERIAIAAAAGQTQTALNDFGRALASGESAQTVILITQRYFMKLHKVRTSVDAGQRLDDALKAMRPPLFFKQRDAFARQVRRWSRAQLDQALKRIADTAKAARLTSALEDVLTERLILSLSLMASAATTVTMRR